MGRATAQCVRRRWSSSTACSSWSRLGSRFQSSRACCRPVWTCGPSVTRSTVSLWSRPAIRLLRTPLRISVTGSSSPAWAAPSCRGPPCSNIWGSTSKGKSYSKAYSTLLEYIGSLFIYTFGKIRKRIGWYEILIGILSVIWSPMSRSCTWCKVIKSKILQK